MTLSEGRYELCFTADSLKEWIKLDNSIRQPFLKRLSKRLLEPRVENERLSSDLKDYYKIKDNKTGYRLVYFVDELEHALVVSALGKRENSRVYTEARKRALYEQRNTGVDNS